MSPAELVLNEIIKCGMIKLAHPQIDEPCVFTWNANTLEQLDAIIHKAYNIPVQAP
jgi:hypothetical protein